MDVSPLVAVAAVAVDPLLLAADFGDFIWVIAMIIAFVVWVYNQIKKANEDAAKKAQQAPQPDVQPLPRTAQADAPSRRQQLPRKRPAIGQAGERPARASAQGTPDDPWAKPEPVASHVRRHLDTQDFEQRTGSLGQLSQLDTDVDDHVQQGFDHTVGTIVDQGAATEAEEAAATAGGALAVSAAVGIADVLADPDSLRNAIILQEILRQPKWE